MRLIGWALVISGLSVMDCVGDSSTPIDGGADVKNMGGLDQPCYQNGTCDTPLTCASNVCVNLTDGGSDSSSGDASDAASDAGSDAPPSCPGTYQDLKEAGGSCASQTCIDVSGSPVDIICGNPCTTPYQYQIVCGDTADCTGSDHYCCLSPTTVTVSSTCPFTVDYYPAGVDGGVPGVPAFCNMTACPGMQLCVSNSECGTGHCDKGTLYVPTVGPASVATVGVCGP